MSLENKSEIEIAFILAGSVSKDISPLFAQSKADIWEEKYEDNKTNPDSMMQGKLLMDYHNKVLPNLVNAKLSTEPYDTYARELSKRIEDKESPYSCPSC